MAFTLRKTSVDTGAAAEESAPRRRNLSSLLGLKGAEDETPLPTMDVAGGLSRALKRAEDNVGADEEILAGQRSLQEALSAIEGALRLIDKIRDMIDYAYESAMSALEVDEAGGRALIAESYDDKRLEINELVAAADENTAHLIGKKARQIDVKIDGAAHYSISAIRLDVAEKGLNLNPPHDAFESDEEVNRTLDEIGLAVERLDRAAAIYGRDTEYLLARLSALDPI